MLTFRVGAAGSPAAGKAMAEYLTAGTLQPETAKAAAYYSGSEVRQEQGRAYWDRGIDQGREAKGETRAELRPAISAAMAARLGIDDPRKPLTQDGIANLLNASRLDGSAIEGRKKHSATRSVADVFGLDPKQLPTPETIRNVLAGKRADGQVPQTAGGKPLPKPVVDGARKRFLSAIGVPSHREPTADEMERIQNGLTARGRFFDATDYRRQLHATRPPIGYVDLTFSADKSLSVAFALARTAHERNTLLNVHKQAVAAAMVYAETQLGFARRGKGGSGEEEPGELAWMSFQHFTARPSVDIERQDTEGRAFTERREVPLQTADPQLHSHVLVLNSVLTEGGHVGAIDRDRLKGRVKEIGAIYQAHVATRARELGIDAVLDQRTGAARITAIPPKLRDLFSKRTSEAQAAAREFARQKGADWDAMTGDQKIAILKAGAAETRQAKEGEKTDFAVWHEQAETARSEHRTVLQTAPRVKPISDAERHETAYNIALPMLAEEFKRRAVIEEQELREAAARALIATGIGKRQGDDVDAVDAVVKAFREQGIIQDGQRVRLLWGPGIEIRGKEHRQVTTGLHVEQERELIRLAKTASADVSSALPVAKIEQAAQRFLERTPTIDPAGAQWQAQHSMMTRLATGGRLGVSIGAAGAGKTTAIASLVDAWKEDGRDVFGITLAWRQANDLRDAGINERASVAAFLKRVETGRYSLDHNSVVVVDEVGLLGTRQMLALLRLQETTGTQIVMIGDPKQAQSIDAGPALELLRKALGEENIPQILTAVRQREEREREIAALFRAGKAAQALEMKRDDGSAVLVAGGREATVQHVARLWRARVEANRGDPEYKLTISAPTNADAREIGAAIRAERRLAGELGDDVMVVTATDRTGETYKLPLAIGDKVRLFDRVHDARAERRKTVLASNGEVVEIHDLNSQGLVVRNTAGNEGLVAWPKIQSRADAPVRLSYGYAMTVDTVQGLTATDHIHAMPAGSHAIHGFKAYVAASRHQKTNWIVVDDASERRQIASRAMLGHKIEITEQDVWGQVASNLERQPLKISSLSILRQDQQRRQMTL